MNRVIASLGDEMILTLDQYLLQYITLLFAQYKACIEYQSQVVEYGLNTTIKYSFVKIDPLLPNFAHK